MEKNKVVIYNYNKNAAKPYLVSVIDSNYNVIKQHNLDKQGLIDLIVTLKIKPLNFSINRKYEIVEDCGALTRLKNSIGVLIILATIENKKGDILGYKVISSANGNSFNLDMNAITNLHKERVNTKDNVLFQNGIVRTLGNNKLSISCFPMKPFDKVVIDNKVEQRPTVVKRDTAKKVYKEIPKIEQPINVELSATQCKEIERCRQAGVDPSILSDTRLTDKQMRILWMAKSKKGSYVECFANADFSEDSMKFYADRIYDKETADKYKILLDRPDLEVDSLQQLTTMIDNGIPCEDLLDKTPEDIYCARIERSEQYDNFSDFGRVDPSEVWRKGNLYDVMIKEALKLGTALKTEQIKLS